jgi:hypothetical protein
MKSKLIAKYSRNPLDFFDGIPIFSPEDRYVGNYKKIAEDHVISLEKTGHNPFMDEVLWRELEDSTKSLIEKYGKIPTKYNWDNTESRLHPLANEDEINEYCKMVTVYFYEIAEVDVDIASWRESQINSIVDKN